jgi:hypothetical protein
VIGPTAGAPDLRRPTPGVARFLAGRAGGRHPAARSCPRSRLLRACRRSARDAKAAAARGRSRVRSLLRADLCPSHDRHTVVGPIRRSGRVGRWAADEPDSRQGVAGPGRPGPAGGLSWGRRSAAGRGRRDARGAPGDPTNAGAGMRGRGRGSSIRRRPDDVRRTRLETARTSRRSIPSTRRPARAGRSRRRATTRPPRSGRGRRPARAVGPRREAGRETHPGRGTVEHRGPRVSRLAGDGGMPDLGPGRRPPAATSREMSAPADASESARVAPGAGRHPGRTGCDSPRGETMIVDRPVCPPGIASATRGSGSGSRRIAPMTRMSCPIHAVRDEPARTTHNAVSLIGGLEMIRMMDPSGREALPCPPRSEREPAPPRLHEGARSADAPIAAPDRRRRGSAAPSLPSSPSGRRPSATAIVRPSRPSRGGPSWSAGCSTWAARWPCCSCPTPTSPSCWSAAATSPAPAP